MDYKDLVKERIDSNIMIFSQEDIIEDNNDDYYLALADDLIDDKCLNLDLRDEIAKEFSKLIEETISNTYEQLNFPVFIYSSKIAEMREEIEKLKKDNQILTDGLITMNAENKLLKKENEHYKKFSYNQPYIPLYTPPETN